MVKTLHQVNNRRDEIPEDASSSYGFQWCKEFGRTSRSKEVYIAKKNDYKKRILHYRDHYYGDRQLRPEQQCKRSKAETCGWNLRRLRSNL